MDKVKKLGLLGAASAISKALMEKGAFIMFAFKQDENDTNIRFHVDWNDKPEYDELLKRAREAKYKEK